VIKLEKNKEDIKLDKIGKLLELGGTMLANHCECGAPLFRYHGNVICPICDLNSKKAIKSQEIKEKTSKEPGEKPPITSDQVEQKIQKVQISEEMTPLTGDQHFTKIPQSFTESPQPFTESLQVTAQRETDQDKIKQQMEAIESGTRALKNLR